MSNNKRYEPTKPDEDREKENQAGQSPKQAQSPGHPMDRDRPAVPDPKNSAPGRSASDQHDHGTGGGPNAHTPKDASGAREKPSMGRDGGPGASDAKEEGSKHDPRPRSPNDSERPVSKDGGDAHMRSPGSPPSDPEHRGGIPDRRPGEPHGSEPGKVRDSGHHDPSVPRSEGSEHKGSNDGKDRNDSTHAHPGAPHSDGSQRDARDESKTGPVSDQSHPEDSRPKPNGARNEKEDESDRTH
jgi:hypothetical protein